MRTAIVIGSGAGPEEPRGAEIDRHLVVRMWNHEWQSSDRFGSRYDHGLITTLDDVQRATRRPAKSWFFYPATKGTRREATVAKIDDVDVIVLNHVRWSIKAHALKAKSADGRGLKFTRGFVAVAGAIECLRPRRIIVIGMDVLRNGATSGKYFDRAALPFYVNSYKKLAMARPDWAADELPAGLTGEGPHDYAVEAVLIRALAAEAGTEIVWNL